MKKNNKGFFLAETIVVIALVTTVMAFVYPNVSKLNENYNNRTKYYDQTEDLYVLKATYNLLEGEYINFVYPSGSGYTSYDNINPNNVVNTNFLGFFTFNPNANQKDDPDSRVGSAGCLNYSSPSNSLYTDSSYNEIYCGTELSDNCKFTGMLKIYDESLIGSLSNGGFELALDYIRENNSYYKTGDFHFESYDYFTCLGDFYGLSNSLNLDTKGGAGLQCKTTKQTYKDFFDNTELKELYIANYMGNPSSSNYNFNKYLKRLKKTSNDTVSYRLIGVFKNGNETRYASIKIDNPNPNRNCNLGG